MEAIEFKYRSVDAHGRIKVCLRRRARLDDRSLVLGREEFPASCLKAAAIDKGRLVLILTTPEGIITSRAIEVHGKILVETMRRINRHISARDAETHRQDLSARGRAAEFRTEPCPYCRCTVDLSGMPGTPQAYCRFCDAMWNLDGDIVREDEHYRVCPQCGFFAQPRPFTTAYIVFAVVMIAWQTNKSVRCHSCMRREAWMMLLLNSVTLLGVPWAVGQLLRSHLGGTRRSLRYHDLDRANRLARRGRVEEADAIYDRLEQHLGVSAGVRVSHGMAFFQRGPERYEEAATQFLAALSDCANHPVAFQAIQLCYQSLGRADELRQLMDVWDIDDPIAIGLGEAAAKAA